MNIGLFDSGLGGLIITRACIAAMPEYNYVYMGDTLHVPYGARSAAAVYEFTRACVDALFRKHDCAIVLIACNTASIAALRRLQREYLPQNFPDRRILGVVIPTAESAAESGARRIGLLATDATARSSVYPTEIKKLIPDAEIFPVAAPLLVPLIENDGDKFAAPVIVEYLSKFSPALAAGPQSASATQRDAGAGPKGTGENSKPSPGAQNSATDPSAREGLGIDTLILGCTHFPHYKNEIAKMMPGVKILSQDEIIPEKLRDYLNRHPEINTKLLPPRGESSRRNGVATDGGGQNNFFVTDISESYLTQAARLFGNEIKIEKTNV
ncbi:MAG: aspartate/glutamate racemase family protein [Rickettsiales bacterium]|jgi:glutamate racemase|nr:aspartate/glutamate racemase family protein [Rickettsiales bacterium]